MTQLSEFAHRARSICRGWILTLRWALFMGATGSSPFAGDCIDVRFQPGAASHFFDSKSFQSYIPDVMQELFAS